MGQKEQFRDLYRRARRDILVFAREMLLFDGEHNYNLSDQQIGLLNCVQDETLLPPDQKKRRIAVRSGQGPGKTTVEVVIGLWRAFLDVDSLVIVTAPTMRQVRDVWIAEARRVLQNAHPFVRGMVEVTNTKIVIGGRPTWGVWTATATKEDNFHGYHQKYLTMIFDEASGIDRRIIQVAKGTLTNENSLMIAAGNPTTRECAFFDFFHKPSEANLWHKFVWNAEEAPHVDKLNLKRIETEFGKASDVYRVRVLGEFPVSDPNSIVSSEDLWGCVGTDMFEAARMRGTLDHDRAIGIDVARFGSDESVIYRRSGHAVVEQCILVKTEPVDVIERAFVMQAMAGWTDASCLYVVDADGMGQGIMGILRRAGKRLLEFHNGGKPSSSSYSNKISEAYFNVAKLAQQRRLHIPNDEILVQQLASRLYHLNKKGKIEIEEKKEFVKRSGHSPDRADALAMCYYTGTMARGKAG